MTPSDSKPWYETAFQQDYLDRYAHRSAEEAAQAVELFAKYLEPNSNRVILDLCCGAGRHSQAFCRAGYPVVGLDLSKDLLHSASSKACDLILSFVRGDMRKLPFENGALSGVAHLFTAFGYFDEDAENFQVFAEVSRILKPGGIYFFDFLNTDRALPEIMAEDDWRTESHAQLGEIRSRRTLIQGNRRIRKTIQIISPDGHERMIEENVRAFTPDEIKSALVSKGFQILDTLGRYDGTPFGGRMSERLIVVARK